MKKILKIIFISLIITISYFLSGCTKKSEKEDDLPELTADMVTLFGTYYYNGDPIEPSHSSFKIIYEENEIPFNLFDYQFSNNIEVGEATVTITCSEYNKILKGSTTINFTILPGTGQIEVESIEEAQKELNGNHYKTINFNKDITIEENEKLIIPKDKYLSFNLGNILINYGTIDIEGYLEFRSTTTKYGKLYNYGTIEGAGTLVVGISSSMYNDGSVKLTNKVSNSGHIYTNSEFLYENKKLAYDQSSYVLRKKIELEDVIFSNLNDSILVYDSTNQGKASFDITELGAINYNYELKEGIIGDAKIVINTLDENQKYYGDIEINYEVIKASISINTKEEFYSALNSKLYNEYIIEKSINLDEAFVLDDDEVIKSDLYIVMGDVTNNGKIETMSLSINNLTNNGDINLNASMYIQGNLINNKNISANSFATSNSEKTFTNNSILNIGSNDSYNCIGVDTKLINNKVGIINLNGRVVIDNINIINEGIINNKAKIYMADSYEEFVLGNFNNDEGYIWAYDNMKDKGIDKNITYKKRLAESEVLLDETSYSYDANTYKPLFTVDGKVLDTKDYYIQYERVSGAADTVSDEIKNVGSINVTIRIKNNEHEYGGSIVLSYEIVRGVKNASTENELIAGIKNLNYEKIILTDNILLKNYGSLTLNDQTLDTNGYRLTINNIFTNYGNVIVRKMNNANEEDNIGLYLNNHFYNYGKVNNDSTIYMSNNVYFYNSGEVINKGKIYTWYNSLLRTQIDGTIYKRRYLNSATKEDAGAVNLSYYETDYTGSELKPEIIIKYDDLELDNEDFNIEYSNNINAGEATINISPKSILNEYFTNETTSTFKINRIETDLNIDLINSLNCDNLFDPTNYYKYNLTKNIDLRHSLTVPDDLIINLNDYEFIPATTDYVIELGEGVRIWKNVDDVNDFKEAKYQYLASKITFTSDIGTFGEEFTLDLSIDVDNLDINKLFVNEYFYDLTIDLNGYNLYGKININYDTEEEINLNIINSKENKSTVYYSETSQSIEIDGGNSDYINITIDNLALNSLWISGSNIQTINVSNCDMVNNRVSTSSKLVYQYGAALFISDVRNYTRDGKIACLTKTTFTNCKFKGETAAYLNGGIHDFIDCSFEATGKYRTYNDFYKKYYRYGNALTIQITTEPMNVNVEGGTMTYTDSKAYAVEIVNYQNTTLSTLKVYTDKYSI